MFVSEALAQTAGGSGAGAFEALLPMLLIFVVFYFLLIRPQQKKAKQHKEMLAALRRGDRVVTGGGIIGTVTKVLNEHEIMVEIADEVRVRVQRGSVAAILAKTEPVKGEGGDEKDDGDQPSDEGEKKAIPPAAGDDKAADRPAGR